MTDPVARDDGIPAIDELLRSEVAYADTSDPDTHRQGVILTVQGQLVSGRIMPGAAYVAYLREHDFLAEHSPMERRYAAMTGSEVTDEIYAESVMIHLDDAAIWTNGERIPQGVWRGRLDRVDGWSYGTLLKP